eukprot:GGOE01011432.1.p7 GENE.GGOE01011432.1~~GGOE01011432.1.p7  ORF type:complete len:103 (-),score=6.13 GGOE01011432.1:776-1084(-)
MGGTQYDARHRPPSSVLTPQAPPPSPSFPSPAGEMTSSAYQSVGAAAVRVLSGRRNLNSCVALHAAPPASNAASFACSSLLGGPTRPLRNSPPPLLWPTTTG